MKKFLLIVVGVVAVGLTLRYTVVKPGSSSSKKELKPPETVTAPQPPPSSLSEKQQPSEPAPAPREPESPPPPPRIAGSIELTEAQTQELVPAGDKLYYCDGGSLMAVGKQGDEPAERVAYCDQIFDFVADAHGVFYCQSEQLLRVTVGVPDSKVVAASTPCIMGALDGKYAYFMVPGFEREEGEEAPEPGVYRVARTGGTPERIHATRPKEQFSLAVDDEALWIGAWSAGTISKLAKTPGAKAKTIITGQKGLVDLAVDGGSLYWHVENPGEVRRRKKTGGKVETLAKNVEVEQVLALAGHVYWFEGGEGEDKRLMHLAPGAPKAFEMAGGLRTPAMEGDADGIYVSELDREGIFMFKR
ncbi:MAG TPA: hypothetical protein VIV11_23895 [Kofleriaceae bacterium]